MPRRRALLFEARSTRLQSSGFQLGGDILIVMYVKGGVSVVS
jgi:hypothetical protein